MPHLRGILSIVIVTGCLCGCTTGWYKQRADREAYAVIQEKSGQVPGMPDAFSLEAESAGNELAGLPEQQEVVDYLGEVGTSEAGAPLISLEKALALAVQNNRTYRNRKESLYLQALALTLERHQYTPIFSGGLRGDYQFDADEVSEVSDFGDALDSADIVISQLEILTGQPADLLRAYTDVVEAAGDAAGWDRTGTRIERERTLGGGSDFSVDLLLKGGGRIALGLTSDFLRFLTGDLETTSSTTLSASFTQPLLRGAGASIAAERLTQAERNVLYELRTFTRFRKEFTVNICASYYGVLQARDEVRNRWRSLQSFQRNVLREKALTEEGRQTQTALGRQMQAELSAKNSWVNAVRTYKQRLDQFKIDLGLSTDTMVILDDRELLNLKAAGLNHPSIEAQDAIQVALAARLDYLNAHDELEDVARGVRIAANSLKPGLNLLGGAQVSSSGADNFQELDFKQPRWNAGLDLDLPLDQKARRNAYRSALIQQERAVRDFSLATDRIKLDVRTAWRNLDQARQNYDNALQRLELNRRRVEEQDLLAELGRATALDQVEAQNDLTAAENELTSSLISHTIARLQFWRDMGILYIKENGQWEEVTDGFEHERAATP